MNDLRDPVKLFRGLGDKIDANPTPNVLIGLADVLDEYGCYGDITRELQAER